MASRAGAADPAGRSAAHPAGSSASGATGCPTAGTARATTAAASTTASTAAASGECCRRGRKGCGQQQGSHDCTDFHRICIRTMDDAP
jgi:hypothetical protein